MSLNMYNYFDSSVKTFHVTGLSNFLMLETDLLAKALLISNIITLCRLIIYRFRVCFIESSETLSLQRANIYFFLFFGGKI